MLRKILIVTKEVGIYKSVTHALGDSHSVDRVVGRSEAQDHLKKAPYDIVFIDLDTLPPTEDFDYQDVINPLLEIRPSIEIVVIAPVNRIRQAVHLVKAGASAYIISPVNAEEVKLVADSIYADRLKEHELDYLRDKYWDPEALARIQTKNQKMAEVFKKIRAVAPTKSSVLLLGETGTGKSMLAALIHQHSNRKSNPFISVHCGAIPDTLIESEFFGHEKGAFTGAVRRKIGKFEMAKAGTLLLDEIGTITPAVQIKLLQVLQDGTFSRVGGETLLQTDARIITATNSDLKKMTDEGRFRRDLFYRLNVFPIEIPPLRDRMEDFPHLVTILLTRLNRIFNKGIHSIHPHALSALQKYHWPGNIRELENILERAFILEGTATLFPESFPADFFDGDMPSASVLVDPTEPLADARQKAVEEFERQYLKELLIRNKGRINKSAGEAAVSTRYLYKLMTKYGIHKEAFREKI